MKHFMLQTNREEIAVSKIIMGSTYLGTEIDDAQTYAFLDYYYAQGGRTIDTARVYGQEHPREVSHSERVIGHWLKERGVRGEITLITKGAHPPLEDLTASRVTATEIRHDIEDSLECLGVDTIDIYFLHRDDAAADLGEVMGVLTKAVAEGKLRAIGASNWSLTRIVEANRFAAEHGLEPFTITELQWSLAVGDADGWGDDTLTFMDERSYKGFQEANIPVLAYASQAKGLFSQYIEQGPEHVKPKAKRFLTAQNIKRIEQLRVVAAKHGVSPAQVALAYIMDNPLPAAAIIGCSTHEQLEDSLRAVEFTLTPKEIMQLEA